MIQVADVERRLASLQEATPRLRSLGTIPVDMVAAAVRREAGAMSTDAEIDRAIYAVASRMSAGPPIGEIS